MHKRFLLLLTIFCITNCSENDQTVARFGPHTLTMEEFKDAYLQVLKQPDVFDSQSLRDQYLNELIDRRLLAGEARSKGMDQDERLRLQVSAFRDKQLRDAHFREMIAPQIEVDDAEIEQVYAFTRERRKLRHLFSPTKTGADSLYNRLKKGVDWMVLAREVFDDPEMAASGGDLGWVHWDQMEYDMAMAAFTQEVRTFSAPVRSRFGYHVLHVDNFEKELIISDTDLNLHRDKTRALIVQKKGDRVASEYIEEMMKGKKIQVRPAVVQRVASRLKHILTRQPNQFDQMNDMQLTLEEVSRLETDLWELRNEPLVIVDGKDISVGAFMAMMNYIPYAALYQEFRMALNYAIRDFVITEEAKTMGLDKTNGFVDRKTRLFEEYQLQLALRRKLATSVTITDSLITAYFEARNMAFGEGEVPAEMKERIKREERLKRVSGHIQKLRSKYEIRIEATPIHAYYDALKRESE